MIDTSYLVAFSSVHRLADTLVGKPVAETSDALFQQITEAKKLMLEQDYTTLPDTSANPMYKDYARIVVNGKVVARLDNHGGLITSNAMGSSLSAVLENANVDASVSVARGPLLALARAEKIAEALKGTVVKSSTALSQQAYDALPYPKATLNSEAMQKDPRYAELESLKQAHAAFLAQQLAQDQAIAS